MTSALVSLLLLSCAAAAASDASPTRHVPMPGPTADTVPLRRQFDSLYAVQARATMERNVDALLSVDAPDHRVRLLNGDSVTVGQLRQTLTGFYTSGRLVREISFSFDILDVARRGDQAVVLVEQKDHRVQIRADGRSHDIVANVVHRDTWRWTADGWRRFLTEEVRQVRFAVDGVDIVPDEHRPRETTPG